VEPHTTFRLFLAMLTPARPFPAASQEGEEGEVFGMGLDTILLVDLEGAGLGKEHLPLY